MKKTKILVLMLITILLIIFPLTINASGAQINPENYHSDGPNTTDVQDMYKFGGKVAGAVQLVGTIISVGTMMIIGIRYVVASVDEKAEFKERMLPYFIGAILLFGASNLVDVIYKMFN